jgi:uncharacterized protein (TIRG00374 family)
LKKRELIFGSVVFLALATLLVYAQHKHPFDWHMFVEQLKLADWRKIGIALGCIYICYAFRAVRWALLIRHIKKVPLFSLLGTQVIGFTAVALIGRIADPVRPYLVSKKTGLPLSNQIAVYIVERLFDAGSMALIFCSVILLAPSGALPHAEIMRKVGYGALATTVLGLVPRRPPRHGLKETGPRRRSQDSHLSRRPGHHAHFLRLCRRHRALVGHVGDDLARLS